MVSVTLNIIPAFVKIDNSPSGAKKVSQQQGASHVLRRGVGLWPAGAMPDLWCDGVGQARSRRARETDCKLGLI